MLKAYEILGTDKPILKEREATHYFLDEIIHLNENPEDYSIFGYVQEIIKGQVFFRAIWEK